MLGIFRIQSLNWISLSQEQLYAFFTLDHQAGIERTLPAEQVVEAMLISLYYLVPSGLVVLPRIVMALM